jgi:anti-sigma factor RsiW
MSRSLNPIGRHRDGCRQMRALMSDYIDGELDAVTMAQLERHVRCCPNCRRMLANFTRTVRGLRSLGEGRQHIVY